MHIDNSVERRLVLDVSHPSNTGKVIVFSQSGTLATPLTAAHAVGASFMQLYTATGTPGHAGAEVSLHSTAASALSTADNRMYFGYTGHPAQQVKLTGDVQGSCTGMGTIKVQKMKMAATLEGYPPADDTGECVMHIRNASRNGTQPNCIIQIGQEGAGVCRLYNVDAHDHQGTRRLHITTAGIEASGSVDTELKAGENFTCSDSSGTEVYRVDASGNVAATSFTCLSDPRMKCNIIPLACGLNMLGGLVCYKYNFCFGDDRTHFGFMSSEVKRVVPELVTSGTNGDPDRINYTELTPVLVLAVQELRMQFVYMQVGFVLMTLSVVACFLMSNYMKNNADMGVVCH